MSHQDEELDEFSRMVTERLQSNRDSARSLKKAFRHLDMIAEMHVKAQHHDRDLLEDVLRLVSIYWSHGTNNTLRILDNFQGTLALKQRLIDMIHCYDIVDTAQLCQKEPTLSRIVEAFPHISLVMADAINANPSMGLKLSVSDRDLGLRVHYLFKLVCFPGLIYVDSGLKAQACLLLFNICHAKAIENTSGKGIIPAFRLSCRFSTDVMQQRLAPLESRLKFTDYIEDITPSADLLYKIWIKVFGDQQVPLEEVTAVTLLHEKVLQSQPLNLATWMKLLAGKK